jgi:hypothetical protein
MKTRLLLLPVITLILIANTPASHAATRALFNGKTFGGWDSNRWFRIENGCIVGGSLATTVPENNFVATTRDYTNFVLRLKFRLIGTNGFINSGVQIRSQRVPNNTEMSGYQCDLGDPSWWASLYDESRRNKLMAQSDMAAINKVLKRGDWNDYLIRAEGRRIRTWINGVAGIDYTEQDASIPQWGKIGLQIHGGGKAEAWFKNVVIEELPAATP